MTTVTVSKRTHRLLKQLKEKKGSSSFDEMFEEIAREKLEIPSAEEMFGSAEVEDKTEIRDREDRIDRYE